MSIDRQSVLILDWSTSPSHGQLRHRQKWLALQKRSVLHSSTALMLMECHVSESDADQVWNKNWVELYRDGYLKYYENDHSPNAEDTIFMPTECTRILTGAHVDLGPDRRVPDRHSHLCLFAVATSRQEWTFCGETLDDMRAWQLALEQARLLIVRPAFAARPSFPCYGSNGQSDGMIPAAAYLPYGQVGPAYVPALTSGPLTFFPPPHHHPDVMNYPVINRGSSFTGEAPLLSSFSSQHPDQMNMYSSPTHFQSATQIPHSRPDSRDVAMGMLAGAAVGSVMYPYFWW